MLNTKDFIEFQFSKFERIIIIIFSVFLIICSGSMVVSLIRAKVEPDISILIFITLFMIYCFFRMQSYKVIIKSNVLSIHDLFGLIKIIDLNDIIKISIFRFGLKGTYINIYLNTKKRIAFNTSSKVVIHSLKIISDQLVNID